MKYKYKLIITFAILITIGISAYLYLNREEKISIKGIYLLSHEIYFKKCSESDLEKYKITNDECMARYQKAFKTCTSGVKKGPEELIPASIAMQLVFAIAQCKDNELYKMRMVNK